MLKTAAKARARSLGPFHPGFNIQEILEEGMRRILPEDIHRRASGRLYISLTRMSDRQNVIVSEFRSKEDLMDVSHKLWILDSGKKFLKLTLGLFFEIISHA